MNDWVTDPESEGDSERKPKSDDVDVDGDTVREAAGDGDIVPL